MLWLSSSIFILRTIYGATEIAMLIGEINFCFERCIKLALMPTLSYNEQPKPLRRKSFLLSSVNVPTN